MSRRKNGTKQEVRALNAYLDTLQAKVYEVHRQLIESGSEISAEAIKNKLTGVADRPKMILDIFQVHNDQLTQLIGIDYAPGTLERYKTSLKHTRDFIIWYYKCHAVKSSGLNDMTGKLINIGRQLLLGLNFDKETKWQDR